MRAHLVLTSAPRHFQLCSQLGEALGKNAVRVIDLFREWDENGDGVVSKKEFRRAMPLLGFDVPKPEIDALFDQFDPDLTGQVEYVELKKHLQKFKVDKPPPPAKKPATKKK